MAQRFARILAYTRKAQGQRARARVAERKKNAEEEGEEMDKKDEEKEVAEKKGRTRKKQQRRCCDKVSAGSTDMEEWLRMARKRRVAVRSVK